MNRIAKGLAFLALCAPIDAQRDRSVRSYLADTFSPRANQDGIAQQSEMEYVQKFFLHCTKAYFIAAPEMKPSGKGDLFCRYQDLEKRLIHVPAPTSVQATVVDANSNVVEHRYYLVHDGIFQASKPFPDTSASGLERINFASEMAARRAKK